jgi:hypothetical protein
MTPIDLQDYAHAKRKIPAAFLRPKSGKAQKISSWKLLGSYLLDAWMVVGSTAMIAAFFKISFASFIISDRLYMTMLKMSYYQLSVAFLPLMFTGYFFFSYFFNHGQSWGLHTVKARITMPEQNFRSSLLWAMMSSLVVMTFGLGFFWVRDFCARKSWGTFEGHDHLYAQLVQEKIFSPVDLVALSEANAKKAELEGHEEHFQQAA